MTRPESRGGSACPAQTSCWMLFMGGASSLLQALNSVAWQQAGLQTRHASHRADDASSWRLFVPMSQVRRFNVSGLVRRTSGGAAGTERGLTGELLGLRGGACLWFGTATALGLSPMFRHAPPFISKDQPWEQLRADRPTVLYQFHSACADCS